MPIEQNIQASDVNIVRRADTTTIVLRDAEGNSFKGTVPTSIFDERTQRFVDQRLENLGNEFEERYSTLLSNLAGGVAQVMKDARSEGRDLGRAIGIRTRRAAETTEEPAEEPAEQPAEQPDVDPVEEELDPEPNKVYA